MPLKRRILLLALVLAAMLAGTGWAETLLVTSDLHLTDDHAAHDPALTAVSEATADCDVLLVLGDSTNNAHEEEYAYVLAFLQSVRDAGREVYAIPGNHDLTSSIHPVEFSALYGDYGWDCAFSRDDASASCAVMTWAGTCLLLLDTNAYTDHNTVEPLGGIADGTLRWLEGVLAALPEGTPVVACGHHPILPEDTRSYTVNAGRLADALRRGGVRVYLCGHDHGFAAVNVDGLQQITVGQPHAAPGWAGRLTVSSDNMDWQVVSLYGEGDPFWQAMEAASDGLGESLGRGFLKGSSFEDDADAIRWFAECFHGIVHSGLTEETCGRLLADPAAQKWREVENRTVVKRWMFGILENCPQDVHHIQITGSRQQGTEAVRTNLIVGTP